MKKSESRYWQGKFKIRLRLFVNSCLCLSCSKNIRRPGSRGIFFRSGNMRTIGRGRSEAPISLMNLLRVSRKWYRTKLWSCCLPNWQNFRLCSTPTGSRPYCSAVFPLTATQSRPFCKKTRTLSLLSCTTLPISYWRTTWRSIFTRCAILDLTTYFFCVTYPRNLWSKNSTTKFFLVKISWR